MTTFIIVKEVLVVIFGVLGIYFVGQWFKFLITDLHDIKEMIDKLKNK